MSHGLGVSFDPYIHANVIYLPLRRSVTRCTHKLYAKYTRERMVSLLNIRVKLLSLKCCWRIRAKSAPITTTRWLAIYKNNSVSVVVFSLRSRFHILLEILLIFDWSMFLDLYVQWNLLPSNGHLVEVLLIFDWFTFLDLYAEWNFPVTDTFGEWISINW